MSDDMITVVKRRPRKRDELKDHRIAGKVYCLSEAQKAAQLNVSASFLQKERLRENPSIDFARFGRVIRYAVD